jgi:hypothetical protein
MLSAFGTAAWAQTGTTYRFQADTLKGTVWVLGDDARRELESGEGGTAAGRIEIWRDGGKEVFVLNPAERTYYEERAFLAKGRLTDVSLAALTVRAPMRADAVENVAVALTSPRTEIVDGRSCQRGLLTFSYTLRLGRENSSATFPGRVEGSQDFGLIDAPGVPRLPFGQGLELKTGHAEVDAALAERLATLKGIPVARMLKVTRRIENGELVSSTSALLLSDVRDTVVEAGSFEVPRGYRFQEPTIAPPVRK